MRPGPVEAVFGGARSSLADAGVPLPIDGMLPGGESWEVEIGFGKGRFLLAAAAARPERRFLGIEMAAKYFRLAERRARRRELRNVLLLRGEALYLLAAVLPPAFARVVHVYFPDPWPKDRHHKRRLFHPETVDLVLRLLEPGGKLCLATDHREYAEQTVALLDSHPALGVERLDAWPEGPRTNYEMKYEREGRTIVRLEATLVRPDVGLLHPEGRAELLAAPAREGQ